MTINILNNNVYFRKEKEEFEYNDAHVYVENKKILINVLEDELSKSNVTQFKEASLMLDNLKNELIVLNGFAMLPHLKQKVLDSLTPPMPSGDQVEQFYVERSTCSCANVTCHHVLEKGYVFEPNYILSKKAISSIIGTLHSAHESMTFLKELKNRNEILKKEVKQEISDLHLRLHHNLVVKQLIRINDAQFYKQLLRSDMNFGWSGVDLKSIVEMLYLVRQDLGYYDDFGLRRTTMFNRFRAQGSYVCKLAEYCQMTEPIKSTLSNWESVKEYMAQKIHSFWDGIKGKFSLVNDKFFETVDKIFGFIIEKILYSIFGDLKGWIVKNQHTIIQTSAIVCSIITFLIGYAIGFITINVLRNLLAATIKTTTHIEVNNFRGQDEMSFKELMLSVCCTVFGLNKKHLTIIKEYIDSVMNLLIGGTIRQNIGKLSLIMLPFIIRYCYHVKYGNKIQELELRIENWRSVAQSMCAISKVQIVVASKQYKLKIEELIKSGTELIRLCTKDVKATIRQSLMSVFTKLYAIHTNLVTRSFASGDRHVPFAIHVEGPPGIGKTTNVKDMLMRATGFEKTDFYSNDNSDEYMSGYSGHPAILMDEFLLGQQDKNYETIEKYLTMVSSGEWRPNFASVDDPNVGIKGNTCKPKLIVTLNNTKYDNIDFKVNEAFQRRRRFVLSLEKSDRFISEETNELNLDYTKYTLDEKKQRVWIKFSIWPAIFKQNQQPIKTDMNYEETIEFLREQYESHVKLQEEIGSEMNSHIDENRSVDDILDEVLREAYHVPNKQGTLPSIISSIFKTVVGQGPAEEMISDVCDVSKKARDSLKKYLDVVEEEVSEGELKTQIDVDENDECDNWFTTIKNRFSGTASSAVAGTAMLVSLICLARSYVIGEEEELTYFGQSDKTNKTTKQPKARARMVKANHTMKGQGPEVSYHNLTIDNKTRKCIPICGRWFLTYSHGFTIPTDSIDWILEIQGRFIKIPFNAEKTFVDFEYDIMLVELEHKQVPQSKDIIKQFITYEDIDKVNGANLEINAQERKYYVRGQNTGNQTYIVEDGARRIHHENMLKYPAPTKLGDCGIPLKIVSGSLVNKIAGFHIAGTDNVYNPAGMGIFVTQEMLRDVIPVGQGPSEDKFARYFENSNSYPNLKKIEKINYNEVINLPCKTKLKRSEIAPFLPWEQTKEPAIMTSVDERANGRCPVEVSLDKLLIKKDMSAELEDNIFERIENELFQRYKNGLNWELVGKRKLTFEEACRGIPKYMNSLTCKTSPGYPLCHIAQKRGKTDFVWFEDGELKYTDFFQKLVLEKIEEMNNFEGGETGHRFVQYQKDELRKMSKILNCETRATFCNDVIALVAFRMEFGAVFAALMNSFDTTGFAVGLNQYSKDMEMIYSKLKKLNDKVGAGDYAEFDQRYLKHAEKIAYNVFTRLCKDVVGSSDSACTYLYEHETNSPFQILNLLIWVNCSNKSGCWLTTIINCIMNNVYFMYVFYEKYPHLSFWVHFVLIVLGDDNLYAVSKELSLTPKEVSERMVKLGQKYTSAFKDREVEDFYSEFMDTTFLGAVPRKCLTGEYTGALRKDTLENTPQWTRDENGTLDQTIQQMVDCASQWDQEYYQDYIEALRHGYSMSGRVWTISDNYYERHYCVSNRTAASGSDFQIFYGQGPVERGNNEVRYVDQSITQIATAEEADQAPEEGNFSRSLVSKCMAAEAPDYNTMPKAYILRSTYTWASTQVADATVAQIDMPFDLLVTGTAGSVQDNGFYQFLYSQPEIEIKILVTGTPVQQGALICYFQPLYNAAFAQGAGYNDYPTFNHIFLTPNNNTAVSIKIPFRYWKTFLNNKLGFTAAKNASIGKLVFKVWSQLSTQTLPTTATVALYSSFDCQFRVPRPRTATGQGPMGATYSQITSSNNYNVGTITGNMPSETTIGTTQTAEGHLSVPTVPLDNPPLSGCSVPVHAILPSMSKGVGVEPTVSLQFHHGMLHRQPDSLRDVEETRIENICSRKGYFANFTITTGDSVGQELLNFPLNSVLSNPTPANSNLVPLNIAVLNLFTRWRADIEIELFVAKTVFHSVRLLCVAGYGESGSLAALNYSAYPNRVAEFTGENQWASTRIPFNAPTEFLRTYDGSLTATQNLDDYSMGTCSIMVLTPLKASSAVVSTSCTCYAFVRFRNIQVFEPRSSQFVSLETGTQLYTLYGQGPMDASEAVREPMTNMSVSGSRRTIQIDRYTGDENEPVVVGVTAGSSRSDVEPTCSLKMGEKYEYCIRDITEIGRRHYFVDYRKIDGFSGATYYGPQGFDNDYSGASAWKLYSNISFYVYPQHPISRIYAGWSGHLKYRFIFTHIPTNFTGNVLANFKVTYVPSRSANVTQTVPVYSGTVPPAAGTANTTIFDHIVDLPGETQVGKTLTGTTSTWNANTYIQKPETAIASPPVEYTVSQGSGMIYVDVSVPFTNNNNYLPTVPSIYSSLTIDPYNGRLCIALPKNFGDYNATMEVYQAFGDDFRLHAYSPSYLHYADGYNRSGTITAPSGGIQIGQNVYGNHP